MIYTLDVLLLLPCYDTPRLDRLYHAGADLRDLLTRKDGEWAKVSMHDRFWTLGFLFRHADDDAAKKLVEDIALVFHRLLSLDVVNNRGIDNDASYKMMNRMRGWLNRFYGSDLDIDLEEYGRCWRSGNATDTRCHNRQTSGFVQQRERIDVQLREARFSKRLGEQDLDEDTLKFLSMLENMVHVLTASTRGCEWMRIAHWFDDIGESEAFYDILTSGLSLRFHRTYSAHVAREAMCKWADYQLDLHTERVQRLNAECDDVDGMSEDDVEFEEPDDDDDDELSPEDNEREDIDTTDAEDDAAVDPATPPVTYVSPQGTIGGARADIISMDEGDSPTPEINNG